jgi:hypothetical protein
MSWMVKWAGAFPPFVREAQGAHFFDVDGHRYTDFCLGDTGAMTGHSPFATVKAAEEQMRRGITLMLPGEDAIFVAEELQKRFNLPYWQFALTATTPIVSRFAFAARSPAVPRFSSSSGAITARWMKPSSTSLRTERPVRVPAISVRRWIQQ